jgi:DNA modification methylase
MADGLAKLEKAALLLAQANTIDDAATVRDMASAAAHWCKAQKLSTEAYNQAAQLKLRAERKAGELLMVTVKRGGDQSSKVEPCLDDLGVTKKESHQWQAVAAVPADTFESYIAEKVEAKKEIRTSDMVREGQRLKRAAKRESATVVETPDPTTPGDWRIINGDVLDGLEQIRQSGERARLIFTDPPYNIGIDYGDGKEADLLSDDAYMTWVGEWLDCCREILTDDGSLWVMIGDEYAAEYCVLLKSMGLTLRSWIKWYETFGVNCSHKFNRTSRHIFYFVKDPKRFVFNREAVTRPSDRQTKYGDKRASEGGKNWDDVWEIPRLTGTSIERVPSFPTQLPLRLVRPIVECASDIGDLVIDPFNGSGTTGVAAIETGRRYIGVELSTDFATKASARLSSAQIPFMEMLR